MTRSKSARKSRKSTPQDDTAQEDPSAEESEAQPEESSEDTSPPSDEGDDASQGDGEAREPTEDAPPAPLPPLNARIKAWLRSLWTTWEGRGFLLAVLVPAIYYTVMVPVEITFGDGPELVTTTYNLGVIHPSGYPLYTLLAYPFVHAPGPSEHWNLVFFLSMLPTVVSCGLLYYILRRLDVLIAVAVPCVWLFAFNSTSLPLATRVEVYALNGMFVAMSTYWLLRYAQEPGRILWARLATMGLGLAMCVHLTSVFWFPGLALALALINPRQIFNPKQLGILFGIGLLCGSLYLYLPLASTLHEPGGAVLWNQPNTWDQFWYHVLGKEYDGFRKMDNFLRDLQKFSHVPRRYFFPGILLLAILGIVEGLMRTWRFAVGILVFVALLTCYVVIYQIGDISTYYGPLFFAGLIGVGLGANWLVQARLPEKWMKDRFVLALVTILLAIPSISTAVRNRGHIYQDVMAEDMSDHLMRNIAPNTIVFTIVDGHTFPMWYQAFLKHADLNVVTIDRVMFKLKDKRWYRDFLRGHYPDVTWPTEEEYEKARGVIWEKWIIDRNRDRYKFAALLANPWTIKGSYPVNRGWHHDIILEDSPEAKEPKNRRNKHAMHIYMGEYYRVRGRTYFFNSDITYTSGEQPLACIVEWWKHEGLKTHWTVYAPGGEKVIDKDHPVPKVNNISWEFIAPAIQKPGTWRCEVKIDGKVALEQEFTLTAP